MRLKTLLYNRGVFTQNVRAVGWISIAYLLSLFFAVPLQILMIVSTHENFQQRYEFSGDTLFRIFPEFQFILTFTIPVLLGLFLFRYIQVKLSADYIHSLPIKREALYHQNVILGIILLIVPVVITGIILFIIGGFIDAPKILNIGTITEWVGSTILVNIFVFIASVFVAMFTGISVFQGVLTYILLIFPFGVTVLFFMNIKYFLQGFAVDYYLNNQIERLLPFVQVNDLTDSPFTFKEVIGFLFITFVLYVIAYFAYKNRKVEMASQAVAFQLLRPVFLYGVTLCTMLLGGMYFGETQGTLGWRLFGYIAASLIGYVIAQMILEKTWRVLKKWKGYGVFGAFMVAIALLISLDVTGYENKIPVVEDIERVYFAQSVYGIDDKRNVIDQEIGAPTYYYYDEVESIEKIIDIHEKILANKQIFKQNKGYRRQAIFAYELTNGKKIVRAYQVPEQFYEQPGRTLSEFMESLEYKKNKYLVLRLESDEKINNIRISSYHGGLREVIITDRDEIKEFHQLLQSEIKDMTSEDMIDKRQPWAMIEYSLRSEANTVNRINVDWKKSYDKIEAWLEDRHLARQVRLTGNDIAFAVIAKRDLENLHDYNKFYEMNEKFQTIEGSIRIEDNDQLEELLRVSSWRDDGEYVIAYYYKNELTQPHFEAISADYVSEFIK